jgi:hypothetical protein
MNNYKYDEGKPRMELLPLDVLEEVARVLTFGAKKYKDNTWQKLKNAGKRYKGALLRHLTAIDRGELYDPESGLLHMSHVACNAMFLLYFAMKKGGGKGEQEKGMDRERSGLVDDARRKRNITE